MNSDCAIRTGKTHSICQDYCATGQNPEAHYVVLADGCSGSPNTDIGARLLVKSAERILKAGNRGVTKTKFYQEAAARALKCAQMLGLESQCLDATLLTIVATENEFTATCYGDGVIAIGRRNVDLDLYSVAFPSGYPDYPSYLLDASRHAQVAEHSTNHGKTITHWTLPGHDEGQVQQTTEAIVSITGTREDTTFVAVLSDGMHSFSQILETATSRTTHTVSITQVASKLLAFKNTKGLFVQRRMQAFLKECAANQWHHNDDLSIGVITFGE